MSLQQMGYPLWGFPSGPVVKNPPAKAGDTRDMGSTPASGRPPGEGVGYPFQYSWPSLVVQMVKNLPAVQKTWVQSLSWKDPPEET